MRSVALVLALAACSNRGSSSQGSGSAPPPSTTATDASPPPVDAAPADAAMPATQAITGLRELQVIKGNTENLFGSELALAKTELFIGESLAGRGRVYIYALDGGEWKKSATLQPAKTGNFGADVKVDGDTLAVSAIEDAQHGKSAGAVFIFERTDGAWKQTAKLVAPKKSYQFGWQIALSGNTLAIGSPWDASGDAHRGNVFVYERTDGAWKLTATLAAPVQTPKDLFGYDVAVRGDRIAVGSLSQKGAPKESGAAYVFERGSSGEWKLAATLVSDDRSERDSFGNDVAVVDDAVIVGAPANQGGFGAGAVYVFRRQADGYKQVQKVQPLDSQSSDYYGDSISAHGDNVLVTSYGAGRADLYRYANGVLNGVDRVDGGRGFASTGALGPDHAAFAIDGRTKGVATYEITRK